MMKLNAADTEVSVPSVAAIAAAGSSLFALGRKMAVLRKKSSSKNRGDLSRSELR